MVRCLRYQRSYESLSAARAGSPPVAVRYMRRAARSTGSLRMSRVTVGVMLVTSSAVSSSSGVGGSPPELRTRPSAKAMSSRADSPLAAAAPDSCVSRHGHVSAGTGLQAAASPSCCFHVERQKSGGRLAGVSVRARHRTSRGVSWRRLLGPSRDCGSAGTKGRTRAFRPPARSRLCNRIESAPTPSVPA